ncbi:hypothetical protein Tco_0406900 [Tanacetum coccineum]
MGVRASNLIRIQIKDIAKEVEDYLKTYSSAGMNINEVKEIEASDADLSLLCVHASRRLKATDRKLANQDKRLKSIIISCLPNDTMKIVIKCFTARESRNDLILSHEGLSKTRDTKIAGLRLKFNAFKALEGEKVKEKYTRLKILLNELENKDAKISQAEVNITFVNSLPKKWLNMNQTQRANNSIKNDSLPTLFGKYNYEEEMIDQIYESETKRFTI